MVHHPRGRINLDKSSTQLGSSDEGQAAPMIWRKTKFEV
jgi:hypothetical protein